MPVPDLNTERLRLEPLRPEHVEALFPIFRDANNMRYWGSPAHESRDDTVDMIASSLAELRVLTWVVIRREDERVLGITVVYLMAAPGLGYLIRRDAQRQGYAREAVSAVIDHAFTRLALDRVELWIHPDNAPSRGLASALGFTQRGQFFHRLSQLDGPHEMLIYGLRASEWHGADSATAHISTSALYSLRPILRVPDVDAAAAYFRDKLGFFVGWLTGDPPSFAIVMRGEWSSELIALHLVEDRSGTAPPLDLYIVCSQIESLYREFLARGVTTMSTPEVKPWGRREFTLETPLGLRMTFSATA